MCIQLAINLAGSQNTALACCGQLAHPLNPSRPLSFVVNIIKKKGVFSNRQVLDVGI